MTILHQTKTVYKWLALAALLLLAVRVFLVSVSTIRPTPGELVDWPGVIVNEPAENDATTRFVAENRSDRSRLLVVTNRFPAWHYGDVVAVSGRALRPTNFLTTTGREFDYASYLAKDNVYLISRYPQLTLQSRGAGNWLMTKLFLFKQFLINRLARLVPEPEQSLLAGVLLGESGGLDRLWQERFRVAGLSHIMVLSGYNLTIVAALLAAVLSRYSKKLAWWGGGAGIILFTLMAGASAATVRAALMSLVAILAAVLGRPYAAGRALLVAIYLMTFWSPVSLVLDLGFQLSILATAGLIYLSPVIANHLLRYRRSPLVVKLVATTLAAQVSVLPWIVYKTGLVSLLAFPANLLILPVIPLAMLLGALFLIIAIILPFSAIIFIWPLYFLLRYVLLVVKLSAAVPGGAYTFGPVSILIPLIAYVAMGVLLRHYYRYVRPLPLVK